MVYNSPAMYETCVKDGCTKDKKCNATREPGREQNYGCSFQPVTTTSTLPPITWPAKTTTPDDPPTPAKHSQTTSGNIITIPTTKSGGNGMTGEGQSGATTVTKPGGQSQTTGAPENALASGVLLLFAATFNVIF